MTKTIKSTAMVRVRSSIREGGGREGETYICWRRNTFSRCALLDIARAVLDQMARDVTLVAHVAATIISLACTYRKGAYLKTRYATLEAFSKSTIQ
jgi:hypothetical protein